MATSMDELNDKFRESAENFSLIPSIHIWRNVEANIRERKRKKRFIIFFFIGAAVLTGGTLWFSNQSFTLNKKTALKENNSITTQQESKQQDISTRGDNSVKEHISIPQPLPANQKQNRNKAIVSNPDLPSSSVSSGVTQIAPPHQTRELSNQKNPSTDNPEQQASTISVAETTPPVLSNASVPPVALASVKDTLQPGSKIDSVMETKENIITRDTLLTVNDTAKTITGKTRWSFAIGAAPALSFTDQQEQGNYQIIANYRNSTDKNLLALNYHFAVHYQIVPELEILTGIGIINFAQKLLGKQAVYRYDTITNPIIAPGNPDTLIVLGKAYFNINSDSTTTVKNTFTYLEIPIGIRYNFFPNHKFNIALQPEISFNKLIHNEGYIYNSQNYTYENAKTADLKPWLLSYGVGISFQYSIHKNFFVEFIPYYKNYKKSVYRDSYPIDQRFQQTEFRLSIHYLVN